MMRQGLWTMESLRGAIFAVMKNAATLLEPEPVPLVFDTLRLCSKDIDVISLPAGIKKCENPPGCEMDSNLCEPNKIRTRLTAVSATDEIQRNLWRISVAREGRIVERRARQTCVHSTKGYLLRYNVAAVALLRRN